MPAGKTTAAQMTVPDICADVAQAKFKGALILGTLAIDDDTLEGKPNDSVNFPK
ncbi:hypothetical protein GCM10010260_30980 [Streptomyces filipinensis]|uniref:Uncharacterized protein n=1 Tax=Streptomyces filipinensis TaxID=66887 RepID=A0A918MAN3_9ACTN|nr:hypothetical protein [Streptomyces filipinensis]GGU93720.1 hypothetical protein GCM10010260_30980 [Streptomyces filipinensis]